VGSGLVGIPPGARQHPAPGLKAEHRRTRASPGPRLGPGHPSCPSWGALGGLPRPRSPRGLKRPRSLSAAHRRASRSAAERPGRVLQSQERVRRQGACGRGGAVGHCPWARGFGWTTAARPVPLGGLLLGQGPLAPWAALGQGPFSPGLCLPGHGGADQAPAAPAAAPGGLRQALPRPLAARHRLQPHPRRPPQASRAALPGVQDPRQEVGPRRGAPRGRSRAGGLRSGGAARPQPGRTCVPRYWWLKISALANRGDWEEMEKFSKSKKSPIGYLVRAFPARGGQPCPPRAGPWGSGRAQQPAPRPPSRPSPSWRSR